MNLAEIRNNIRSNKDIEVTLEHLGTNMQYKQYKAAIYNLLFNYITFLEIIEEEEISGHIAECIDVHETIKYIKKVIIDYNGLITFNKDRKQLTDIINKIQGDMEVLSHYIDEVEIYEYIINRIEGRFTNNYYELEDDESFAGYLIQNIFDTEDNVVINEKIKLSLSQLPIRITKNKFYDYIEDSFEKYKGSYITDFNSYIELLKDVAVFKDDNIRLQNINTGIDILRKTDYKHLDTEGFNKIDNLKSSVAEKIDDIHSVYTLATNIINNLIEISYCDKYDSYIDDNDLVIVDEIFNLVKIKNNNSIDSDEIHKSLERIEGVIENNFEEINKYSGVFQLAKDKYRDEIDEYGYSTTFRNIEKIDYMLSTSSYFANPESMDDKKDESRVDEFTLAKTKKEFISFMDDYLKDKDRQYRRAIMARLFYYLPVAFKKPQDIHSYILNSLQQCSDLNEKNAAKEILRGEMDEF
ncbi:hypothetical protein SH1V18_20380 [Vallitalea longa]|uniref:Uncharacterized protein n=1 Tax=Vallitalea longa TaxID=2936439 RepID=A0A9W5YC11_9FIRM|nr:hypothetical protein [Vallitalea longa]GKX29558.1 hypothetical protein SH1V18_20380 [Vallitalea longa]